MNPTGAVAVLLSASHLVAYSLVPLWMSPEPSRDPSAGAIAVFWTVAIAGTYLLGRLRAGSRLLLPSTVLALSFSAATVGLAVAAAALWQGAYGPLGRAAVVVGPLAWAAVAAALHAAVRRLGGAPPARALVALAVVAAGATELAIALPRLFVR